MRATIAVLFSAGLDSAVLLAQAAHEHANSDVQPIYVSAGLAWEAEERAMAERLLQSPPYTSPQILPLVSLTVDMRDVYPASHWAIRGQPPNPRDASGNGFPASGPIITRAMAARAM